MQVTCMSSKQQQAAASSSKQHSSSSCCAAAARSRRGRRLAVPSSTLFQDEVFLNITPHTVSAHYTLGCGGFLRVDGCSETPSQLALEYETMRWAGLSCGFPGKIIIPVYFQLWTAFQLWTKCSNKEKRLDTLIGLLRAVGIRNRGNSKS
jgi:hypothetical protein